MTWQDLLAGCVAKPAACQDERWEGDAGGKGRAKNLRVPGRRAPRHGRPEMRPHQGSAGEWLPR